MQVSPIIAHLRGGEHLQQAAGCKAHQEEWGLEIHLHTDTGSAEQV